MPKFKTQAAVTLFSTGSISSALLAYHIAFILKSTQVKHPESVVELKRIFFLLDSISSPRILSLLIVGFLDLKMDAGE